MKEGNKNNKIIQPIILCHYLHKVEWMSRMLKTDRLYDKQIVLRKDEICTWKMDTRTLEYYLCYGTHHKIDKTGKSYRKSRKTKKIGYAWGIHSEWVVDIFLKNNYNL